MADKIGDDRFGSVSGQDDQAGFGVLGVAKDPANTDRLSFGVLALAGAKRSDAKNFVDRLAFGGTTTDALGAGIPSADDLRFFGDNAGLVGLNAGSGIGVIGIGNGHDGVHGRSHHKDHSGVAGINEGGGIGVFGASGGPGIVGFSEHDAGVIGRSSKNGVAGLTTSDTDAGVSGRNDGKGFGVFGSSAGGAGVEGHSTNGTGVAGFSEHGLAGHFQGDVEVTGDIRLTGIGQDCAEDFEVAGSEKIEPGTVMVIDQLGALRPSEKAYDKRVAGVVSGAGDFKPAILLGTQQPGSNRTPIALLGKVYCNVDAQYGSVKVGDLLTTSSTPGHAMRADDPLKAFGAVIGKALRPLNEGQGLIPILIALQ